MPNLQVVSSEVYGCDVEYFDRSEAEKYKEEAIVRETPFSVCFWSDLQMVLFWLFFTCLAVLVVSLTAFLIEGTFWTISYWVKWSLWGSFFGWIVTAILISVIPKPQTNVCWRSYSLQVYGEFQPILVSQLVNKHREQNDLVEFYVETLCVASGKSKEAFLVMKLVHDIPYYLMHWEIEAKVEAPA